MTAQEYIDLLSARTLYLEGKLEAFANIDQQRVRAENTFLDEFGPRPTQSSWADTILTLFGRRINPSAIATTTSWGSFDREWETRLEPYASALRSATRRLQSLTPEVGNLRNLTQDQMTRISTLTSRANTALRRARIVAQVYQESPFGRHDPNVTEFWTGLLRELSVMIPMPGTEQAVAQGASQIQQTVRQYESDILAARGQEKFEPDGNWWSRLTWRDKLAIVGAGSIGVGALVVYLKLRRLLPF